MAEHLARSAEETSAAVATPSPMGFWHRIQEHKILQWGLGYVGVAIAIAHGQELLADAFDWPHLIGRLLMSVLVLGLPVVLTLAWYHGHMGLKHIGQGELAIVSLLVLIGAGLLVVLVRSPSAASAEHRATAALDSSASASTATHATAPVASPQGTSLAVLPFADMSPQHDQEYFSDGLSEELLNQLAQIKDLKVAGRTSSFSFKGKNEDLRLIGEQLGVNHLLEGSVRKDGTQLRITAQLINARTGVHIWSQTYDRKLEKVFSVQEDIAKDVAGALSIALDVGDMSRARGGTNNLDAYDKYLRAGNFFNQGGPANFRQSVQLYHEAVALDANFARAWYGLYRSLEQTLIFIPENAAAISKEMSAVTARIEALAPDAWSTQLVRAAQATRSQQWSAAETGGAAALTSAPSTENAALSYGVILQELGRVNEGLEYIQRARQADPLSLTVSFSLQMALDAAGRPDDAQTEYERSRTLVGNHAAADNLALRRLLSRQNPAGADLKARLRDFLRSSHQTSLFGIKPDDIANKQAARSALHQQFVEPARQVGNFLVLLGGMADVYGDKDLALAALRRGFVDLHATAYLSFWPVNTTGLHSDPRFKQLVRDLGFVDYFRSTGKWNDFCHPAGKDDFECR
jgi:TolB-like protein/tetratricopeptide (TPR) repeat protein